MPHTRPHSIEPQKGGLPSSDPKSIDLPLFCPGGEQEVSVVSEMMTSAPHKDKAVQSVHVVKKDSSSSHTRPEMSCAALGF